MPFTEPNENHVIKSDVLGWKGRDVIWNLTFFPVNWNLSVGQKVTSSVYKVGHQRETYFTIA